MDVSNSTGQDTQYRVARGGGQKSASAWQPLPSQTRHQFSDLRGPWTIQFQLSDGTILSATYDSPKAAVELEKTGNQYVIKAFKIAA